MRSGVVISCPPEIGLLAEAPCVTKVCDADEKYGWWWMSTCEGETRYVLVFRTAIAALVLFLGVETTWKWQISADGIFFSCMSLLLLRCAREAE